LSCTRNGAVDLWNEDDGSGRQRFFLVEQSNGSFHIEVAGGTYPDKKVLSCTSDGETVDLYARDDDSGRQQWFLEG